MRPSQVFLFVVLFAVSLKSTQAFPPEYNVFDNTSGTPDTRFTEEVGIVYSTKALRAANEFVLNIFSDTEIAEKGYEVVLLVVESFVANGRPFAIASTNGNVIHVNADYLQTFPGNMIDEFTGIVYFSSSLVWQWTGNGGGQGIGNAPTGLITGIADYIRQTAGWGYEGWPPRGSGLRWDEGYAVTANFLEYCDMLLRRFVGDLNAMMIATYDDTYFVELLGKSVDELWEDYKLFYGSPGPASAPAQTFGN